VNTLYRKEIISLKNKVTSDYQKALDIELISRDKIEIELKDKLKKLDKQIAKHTEFCLEINGVRERLEGSKALCQNLSDRQLTLIKKFNELERLTI